MTTTNFTPQSGDIAIVTSEIGSTAVVRWYRGEWLFIEDGSLDGKSVQKDSADTFTLVIRNDKIYEPPPLPTTLGSVVRATVAPGSQPTVFMLVVGEINAAYPPLRWRAAEPPRQKSTCILFEAEDLSNVEIIFDAGAES